MPRLIMRVMIASLASLVFAQSKNGFADNRPAGGWLAADAAGVKALGGVWDLTGPGNRICRVQMNLPAAKRDTLVLGMPPACRASMPALGAGQFWARGHEGDLYWLAQDGTIVLRFKPDGPDAFASGTGEQTYTLKPVAGRYGQRRHAATPQAADPALAPLRHLIGRYDLTRQRDGLANCLLTLGLDMRVGTGWNAALDLHCTDDGLKTFAPAAWRYENERIFLIARKGHSIGFSRQPGSAVWFKDPPAGAPLYLRKTP